MAPNNPDVLRCFSGATDASGDGSVDDKVILVAAAAAAVVVVTTELKCGAFGG